MDMHLAGISLCYLTQSLQRTDCQVIFRIDARGIPCGGS